MVPARCLFRRRSAVDVRRCGLWVVLVPLCYAATTLAQWPGQPPPVVQIERIRLEGHFGPPEPRSAATDLTLGYKEKIYHFQLTQLRVLYGTELYSHILATVQPFRPNFILRGRESEMRKLETLPPGEPVAITGVIHPGGQNVLVEAIQVGPENKAGKKSTQ